MRRRRAPLLRRPRQRRCGPARRRSAAPEGTLALGRRLITTLDEAGCARFFGAPPPCLVADTPESCALQMGLVLKDPQDTAGIGAAAAAWIETYHSAKRIVALQATAYLRMLETMA